MGNLATLEIGEGDFEKGFPVTLRIGTDGNPHTIVIPGHLPPAPMIPKRYECWKSSYRDRGVASYRKLEPIQGQKTHISIIDSANVLQDSINDWLNPGNRQFTSIRDKLLKTLSQTNGKTRFIIQTDDIRLWRLPWHLWDVLDSYKVEVTFSPLTYEKGDLLSKNLKYKVRILVILGDSTDIDVQADLELLKQRLPDAYIFPLIATRRNQLSDELWGQDWDILFFAGHSSSESEEERGRLYINETENISIEDLKYALQKAINRGLRLAIFNSCDGLGLARDLASLQMPAIIVMRERIPDEAAQKFLEFFLEAFARNNKSLNDSVREARERLHGWEGKYPCASWLPVIFQNPAEEPLTWIGLRKRNLERKQLSISRVIQTVILTSVLVTGAVMGVRSLGFLQPSELQAYDRLMRSRPIESPDPRILVVEITDNELDKYGNPLKDITVVQLIKKIEEAKPLTIGLALHRYQPREPGRKDLIENFKRNRNFLTVCAFGYTKQKGYTPPPEFTQKQVKEQVGFSDLEIDDRPDNIGLMVRRQLLSYDLSYSPSSCATPYSFSFQLAYQFLSAKGKALNINENQEWHYQNVVFKPLTSRTGGYQNLDKKVSQILLRYRANTQPAQKVLMSQILEGQIDRNLIKDRIVIIGTNDPRNKEDADTPYGRMPTVWIHTHMVSQIISAVMDNRPLLWLLPEWSGIQWGDALFVWVWALTSGLLAWRFQSLLHLALAIGITTLLLYQVCLIIFTNGGWMPLIPSALSLLATGGTSVIFSQSQKQKT